jgi:hypothetical protein
MLRLACCKATEEGIKICAPVHDAVLIEAPLDVLDQHIERMREIMAEASRIVLNGIASRTDVEIVRYPHRYLDPRGERMWNKVMQLIAEAERRDHLTDDTPQPRRVHTRSAGPSIILS